MAFGSPRILFNASVVLAGLKSPKGGSGKLLSMVRKSQFIGIISETIADEIIRNSGKIGITEEKLNKKVSNLFKEISKAPSENIIEQYKSIVKDLGDAHVLASAKENKADFLITLDQKHLLILKDKIKNFKIVSPGDFLQGFKKFSLILPS